MNVHVKRNLVIFSILLLYICVKPESEAVPLSAIQVATEVAANNYAKFLSNLRENLDGDKIQDTEDVAYLILTSIPIYGDIIKIFTGDESDDEQAQQKLYDKMDELTNQLSSMEKQVLNKIDISIYKSQVAADKREISSCFLDLKNYVRNPNSSAIRASVISCYDKMSFLRDIGNILSGKKITFDSKPLFEELRQKRGYCNGTEISVVFKYLFGLYIEGCTALGTSEILKFKDSRIYHQECNDMTANIFQNLKRTYTSCLNSESCDDNSEPQIMSQIIFSDDTLQDASDKLSSLFPWYYFLLIHTENKVEGDVAGPPKRPSIMKKKIQDGLFFTAIWFPSNNDHQLYGPNIQNVSYTVNQFLEYKDTLGMVVVKKHNKVTTFFGKVNITNDKNRSFHRCYFDISQENIRESATRLTKGQMTGICIVVTVLVSLWDRLYILL